MVCCVGRNFVTSIKREGWFCNEFHPKSLVLNAMFNASRLEAISFDHGNRDDSITVLLGQRRESEEVSSNGDVMNSSIE